MNVGTAWEDITPDRPLHLQGQMHTRLGEYTRDPLTANAAVFDDGSLKVAVVSVDLCIIVEPLMREIQAVAAEASGIDAEHILVCATHTHVGPCPASNLVGDADPRFVADLKRLAASAVKRAVDDLEEANLFAGSGYVEHMGWNRRGLRRDGAAHMYWGSWAEGFVGVEGPRDGGVEVLCARVDDRVKLVMSSFSTHPNTLESGSFYSADIPGEVRRVLRGVLGAETGVVYLTGAAGDTAPSIMENNPENIQPWRGEEGLKRSGAYLGGEILNVVASLIDPMPDPVLEHERTVLEVPIREWDDNADYSQFSGGMSEFFEKGRDDWDRMKREESPVDVPVNVVRVGDAAICLNPAELYCIFGRAMKDRSPAKVTLVSELGDGYVGYVSTPHAIRHGGYSALAASHTRLAPDAGWRIVEATEELMSKAWA